MFTPQQDKAIRLVVGLLVAGLAVSVAFAVTIIVVRPGAATYQRAVPVLVVAVAYLWVIRRLLAGDPRAYRRVRLVSAFGLVTVGWLFASGAYSSWLRGVQAVQVALLLALVVAVNRPVVRAAFPKVPDRRPRNRRAALALAVIAPLCAEVSVGNVPLRQAWVALLFVPIYGAGSLLIREVVRRTGGGWVNILILGVAYGLVEEGLALQSLTSPHLYGAAEWAPRVLGVNTAYALLNLVYHPIFSVAVPIALTERLFAGHGPRPYLRRGGLIATGIVALLGAGLLRISIPPSEDPGYTMPGLTGAVVAVLALAVVVLGLRLRVPAAQPVLAPPVALQGIGAAAATFAFIVLLWPLGDAKHALGTHGAWAFLTMAAALALVVAAGWALRRWDADLTVVCLGALVGHTVFALVGNADTTADRIFLVAVALGTAALGVLAVLRTIPGPKSVQHGV